jgi:nucleotide-binding universal stress UspA family protein
VIHSIVVGTDGSETARKAVQEAVDLAKQVGASIAVVSAYEPVSSQRLREEARQVPGDLQWRASRARAIRPTPSSTWPRSAERT